MQQELEVSQRRACAALGVPRSTARYEPKIRDDEQELTDKLAKLKVTYPEWGYKKMTRCLKNLGYEVNYSDPRGCEAS